MLPSAAKAIGRSAASDPPAMTTSHSPERMSLRASWNAMTLLAHAATCVMTGYASEPFRQTGKWSEALRTLWLNVRSRPDLCGLGLYGEPFAWASTPGYTGLNRAVPIYLAWSPEALAAAQPGFNYLIATTEVMPKVTGYRRVTCSGSYCLLRKEQVCTPVPAFEINPILARLGQ